VHEKKETTLMPARRYYEDQAHHINGLSTDSINKINVINHEHFHQKKCESFMDTDGHAASLVMAAEPHFFKHPAP
jgi:hypothetical protein